MKLHVSPELKPIHETGRLADWVAGTVEAEGGRAILLGVGGRYKVGAVEVIGVGPPPSVPTSDVVEWALMLTFSSLAEIPYRLDPSGVDEVVGHEWVGALTAYVLSKRLGTPFTYYVYTVEPERGGAGIVSESIKSIEKYLMENADEVRFARDEARMAAQQHYGFARAGERPSCAGGEAGGVLHVSWEYPPHLIGGLGRAVTYTTRGLARRRRVTVLTLGLPGQVRDESWDGLSVYRVDPFRLRSTGLVSWVYLFNFLMLEKALCSVGRPSLIHIHDWLAAPAGVSLKHLWRVPLVLTVHATEYGRSHGALSTPMQQQIHYWEWRATYEAWKITVCSHSMRSEVAAAFSTPSDKIAVIPNGVDLGEVDGVAVEPGARERYALPWEKIICFAGRHVHDKGVDILVLAARRVLEQRSSAKFVVAGDGPARFTYMEMAARLGLGAKIQFIGRVPDEELFRLFKLSHAVVVPSRYEPFGIVALEAMAAGKPVIASSVGGLSEIVVHGETGLLVPPEDPEALAGAVVWLLDHEEEAVRMGINGRRRVEQLYRWDTVVKHLESLYNRVLDEYSASRWLTLMP